MAAEKVAAQIRRRLSRANSESALREKHLSGVREDLLRAQKAVRKLEGEVKASQATALKAQETAKKADAVVRDLRAKLVGSEKVASRLEVDRTETKSAIGVLKKKIVSLGKSTGESKDTNILRSIQPYLL